MKKRLLAMLLAVVMVCSLLPVSAMADDVECTWLEDCQATTHNEGCLSQQETTVTYSDEVTAFLEAVDDLYAVAAPDGTINVTESNYSEIAALIDACDAAYALITEADDLALDVVVAADEQVDAVYQAAVLVAPADAGIATIAEDDESVDTTYNLENGAVTISEENKTYKITGSITVNGSADTANTTAAIIVEENVDATITLSGVNITVSGEKNKTLAAIYIKNGATVTLTLDGENSITGTDLPNITKDASTNVIGIQIGGGLGDSSESNNQETSLTITGSGSLGIENVGTGVSITALNSLTINGSGVSVNTKDIVMMDSTIAGRGIYNNGTLEISGVASLTIDTVNEAGSTGTYLNYPSGYGIASQNEDGVTITGTGTTVSITGAYLSGVYCSDKTESETDNYLTVTDNAQLIIDGGDTSTAAQHAGIKMESNGTILVTDGASIDISSIIYGIATGDACVVEVDGNGSQIYIHDFETHAISQQGQQGIYAGANTIINAKNYGDITVEDAGCAAIDFESGTSGKDGIFVTDNGTLNIADSTLGIYLSGGTTSVEFTNKANVDISGSSVCIGGDGGVDYSVSPTTHSMSGHILINGSGTTVKLNGDWVFSLNYKCMEISDEAVLQVEATSEAISLGSWGDGTNSKGASLIVTGDAILNIILTDEAKYSGIATYGTSHYVEFSDGAKVTITGGDSSYGMSLSKPTTVYVSDATLEISSANGIKASGTDNLSVSDQRRGGYGQRKLAVASD